MKRTVVTTLFLTLLLLSVFAADVNRVELTLPETIDRARTKSVNAAVALDKLRRAYWQHRSYRASLLPEVAFEATVPAFRKQYSVYQFESGEFGFVRNNYLDITGTLSLTQNIWATGGTLSLNTSLDYLRQLSGNRYNRFMSIPVALTLNQPLFAVNSIKWDRRIEPVRYAEAMAEFLSETEEVAMTAISYFFNLLSAREEVAIEQQNLSNAVRLHEVAKAKREMGQISGNDLLQMELNELNARSALTDAESNMRAQMFRLRSFLDYGEDVEIVTVIPGEIPEVEITYSDALDKALANNEFSHSLRRRQLEADYEVAKARGNMRRIDVFAQIGYTGAGGEADEAYRRLKDNQVVEVGVKIPLLDWGKRRGQVKVAESNREVTRSNLRLEAQNFNQDLFILVERFNNQREQLRIAGRSDEISSRRYETNVQTYLIGKLSTLDLNDSQVKKDESRQAYFQALYLYWYYFYQLRSLTLWDYAASQPLTVDFDRVIRQ